MRLLKMTVLQLVRLIGASLFSLVIYLPLILVIRMVSTSHTVELAVDTIIGIIAASLMLLYLSYRERRYSREKVSLKITVGTFAAAEAIHLALSIPFHFSVLMSGCASDLANLFINGGETRLGLKEITVGAGALALLICDVFYVGAVIAGHIIGTRKREADKAELTGNK